MKKDVQKYLKEDRKKKEKIVKDTRAMLEPLADGEPLEKFDSLLAEIAELVQEQGLRPDAYTFRAMLEGIRLVERFKLKANDDGSFEAGKKEMVAPLFTIALMASEIDAEAQEDI
jgi:hypothetical protein